MMSLVYETETGRECLGWKLKVSRARDKEGELREKGLTTRAGLARVKVKTEMENRRRSCLNRYVSFI
jgi:hypothetical protein